MKIKFWGTRGSIGVPGKDTTIYGGNTTCLEITSESGRKIVIDAGTGIRCLGQELATANGSVDIHLLVTHIHWDHIQGFPFFDPVYNPSSRILIDGFPTCMKGLRVPFDNKMGDGFFPIKFDHLKADIQYLDTLNHGPLKIDNVIIDSIPLQHPQGGFGFRFREDNKTFIFITDNELTETGWSGTRPEDYVKFCKNADILVHDAQYTPEEIEKKRGWGHSDYLSTLDMALKADVKQLFLFHHDRSRKDSEFESILARCEDAAKKNNADIFIDATREENELTL